MTSQGRDLSDAVYSLKSQGLKVMHSNGQPVMDGAVAVLDAKLDKVLFMLQSSVTEHSEQLASASDPENLLTLLDQEIRRRRGSDFEVLPLRNRLIQLLALTERQLIPAKMRENELLFPSEVTVDIINNVRDAEIPLTAFLRRVKPVDANGSSIKIDEDWRIPKATLESLVKPVDVLPKTETEGLDYGDSMQCIVDDGVETTSGCSFTCCHPAILLAHKKSRHANEQVIVSSVKGSLTLASTKGSKKWFYECRDKCLDGRVCGTEFPDREGLALHTLSTVHRRDVRIVHFYCRYCKILYDGDKNFLLHFITCAPTSIVSSPTRRSKKIKLT